MNKNQFTAHAAAEASVTGAPAHRLVGAVFPAIADAHARDDTVAIARIGKFDVRSRPAHIERNPQTGDAEMRCATHSPLDCPRHPPSRSSQEYRPKTLGSRLVPWRGPRTGSTQGTVASNQPR